MLLDTLTSWARRDALANTICRGPPGVKLAGLATSIINVGLSSCSRSSTIPTFPSSSSPDCVLLLSPLNSALLFSRDIKFPGICEGPWWLAFPTLPLASLNVVMPPESSRTLFRIAATACEVAGLGASPGRCFVGDGNNGEGGESNTAAKPSGEDSGPRVCRRANSGRLFLRGGSDKIWDWGCFKEPLLDTDFSSLECSLLLTEDIVSSPILFSCDIPGFGTALKWLLLTLYSALMLTTAPTIGFSRVKLQIGHQGVILPLRLSL